MSQTFFSKQDLAEKLNRLQLLGNLKGTVTIWLKGNKEKFIYNVSTFDKDRIEIVLDAKENVFSPGQTLLCTFEIRGMNFFSEVVFQLSISGYNVLQFKNTLYKSERRSSYRLLTYPIYEVHAEFDLGESYDGGKVVDFKSRTSQTGLFRNFLKLVGNEVAEGLPPGGEVLQVRVQDLSTTGMAIHISEIESKYFQKDHLFKNVKIRFTKDVIQVPEVMVVYVVDYLSTDKNTKKYKVGLHFNNLPISIDDLIGKKINSLLRENDFNKDFENFVK
jgi:hypothetical protein